MPYPLFDAHNHLHDEALRPHLEGVCSALEGIGLAACVVDGTEEADWPAVAALAARLPWVRPSFGLHPWRVKERSAGWLDALRRRLDEAGPRAGVGEIGLDRWIPGHDLDDQRPVFAAQLRLAAAADRPATIHCLHAWGALAGVLRDEPVPARGFLLHAYGGPAAMVESFARQGAYFSFNGAHLHPAKTARREIFRAVPLERLLVETDAPAMPPPPEHAPWSLPPAPGGRVLAHPANIAHVHEELARLRGIAPEVLAAQIEQNFRRLFGGP